MKDHHEQMGHPECDSALLPAVRIMVCSCYDSCPEICPSKKRLEWIHLLPLSTRKLHFTVYFALFLFWGVITTLAENKGQEWYHTPVKEQTHNYMAAPWSSSTKSLDQQAATNQTRKNSENSLSLHLTRLFQATVMLPFLNFGAIDFRTDRNTLGTENIMFQIRPHPRSPNRSEPSNPPKSTIQIIELIWHS